MRRWLRRVGRVRLRVRTALGLVAAVALIVVAMTRWIPYALWRVRLERAIAGKIVPDAPVEHFLFSEPSFQLFHGLTDDDLRDFRRDPNFLVDRLLRSIGCEGDERGRRNTLAALDRYLEEVEGPELPRRFIARGVRLIDSGKLPALLESELALALVRRATYLGIGPADREAFRSRARVVLGSDGLTIPEVAWNWAGALAALGGREETEIVVALIDRWTGPRRDVLFRSGLGMTRRPDLLPRFRAWFDDPVLASEIFQHKLVRERSEGRANLLDYALDLSRPADPRQSAASGLMGYTAIDAGRVLALVSADADLRARLASIPWVGPDPIASIREARKSGQHATAWHFFTYSASETDPAHWGAPPAGLLDPESIRRRAVAEERAATALEMLRAISGRDDLKTAAEWQAWAKGLKPQGEWDGAHDPPPLDLRLLLEQLLAHPEFLEESYLAGFVANTTLGELPPEIISLYRRLVHLRPFPARFAIAEALLIQGNCPDAVPVLLDMIEEEAARKATPPRRRDLRARHLLRDRFGVNFLDDVAAWRRWWAEYRPPSGPEPAFGALACQPVTKGGDRP